FNNIRIVALLSVLFVHTCLSNWGFNKFSVDMSELSWSTSYNQLLVNSFYLNIFKSGTILFFIISGFLFEKQYQTFTDFSLFVKKKARSLLRPYLILFIIPTFVLIWIIEPNIGVTKGY